MDYDRSLRVSSVLHSTHWPMPSQDKVNALTVLARDSAFFRFDNLFGPRSRYPPLDGQSQSE